MTAGPLVAVTDASRHQGNPAHPPGSSLARRRGSERGKSGPRRQRELGEDVPEVALHGLLADHQLGGDLPVRPALRDQRCDLPLTRRQDGERAAEAVARDDDAGPRVLLQLYFLV